MALSSVCITSRITERRDHARTRIAPSASRGWRSMLSASRTGWFRRVPASIIRKNKERLGIRAAAVGDRLDMGVGVRVDARRDRDSACEVARIIRSDDGQDRFAVGAY
jgi:hypothetical protein